METKSITDFDYARHQKGTLINVEVKETVKIDKDADADRAAAFSNAENDGDKIVVKTLDLNK